MASLLEHIEQLARRLPFEVDDSASVNAAYRRWFKSKDADKRQVLDLWTYCYVYRYFTWKYIQNAAGTVADFEHLIARTMRKVNEHRSRLDATARYASWVSVVCRHTFLNFARSHSDLVYLDQQTQDSLVSEATPVIRDSVIVRRELAEAISRLPEYLREPATLRFLRQMEYDEIEKLTGRSVPTLRAYCHKAMLKLRDDEAFRAFYEKWDDDPYG